MEEEVDLSKYLPQTPTTGDEIDLSVYMPKPKQDRNFPGTVTPKGFVPVEDYTKDTPESFGKRIASQADPKAWQPSKYGFKTLQATIGDTPKTIREDGAMWDPDLQVWSFQDPRGGPAKRAPDTLAQPETPKTSFLSKAGAYLQAEPKLSGWKAALKKVADPLDVTGKARSVANAVMNPEQVIDPIKKFTEGQSSWALAGLTKDQYDALPMAQQLKLDAMAPLHQTKNLIQTAQMTVPYTARQLVKAGSGIVAGAQDAGTQLAARLAGDEVPQTHADVVARNKQDLTSLGLPASIADIPQYASDKIANLWQDPAKVEEFLTPGPNTLGGRAGQGVRLAAQMLAPTMAMESAGVLPQAAENLMATGLGVMGGGGAYDQSAVEKNLPISGSRDYAITQALIQGLMPKVGLSKLGTGYSGMVADATTKNPFLNKAIATTGAAAIDAVPFSVANQASQKFINPDAKLFDPASMAETFANFLLLKTASPGVNYKPQEARNILANHDLSQPLMPATKGAAIPGHLAQGSVGTDEGNATLDRTLMGIKSANFGDQSLANMITKEGAPGATPEDHALVNRIRSEMDVNWEDSTHGRPPSYPNAVQEFGNLTPVQQRINDVAANLSQSIEDGLTRKAELKGDTPPEHRPYMDSRVVLDHPDTMGALIKRGGSKTRANVEKDRNIMALSGDDPYARPIRIVGDFNNSRVFTSADVGQADPTVYTRTTLNKVLAPMLDLHTNLNSDFVSALGDQADSVTNGIIKTAHNQLMDAKQKLDYASTDYDAIQSELDKYNDVLNTQDKDSPVVYVKGSDGYQPINTSEIKTIESALADAHTRYLTALDDYNNAALTTAHAMGPIGHAIGSNAAEATAPSALNQKLLNIDAVLKKVGDVSQRYAGDPKNIWMDKGGNPYTLGQATVPEAENATGLYYSKNSIANNAKAMVDINNAIRNTHIQQTIKNQVGGLAEGMKPEETAVLGKDAQARFPEIGEQPLPLEWTRILNERAAPNTDSKWDKRLQAGKSGFLKMMFQASPFYHSVNNVTLHNIQSAGVELPAYLSHLATASRDFADLKNGVITPSMKLYTDAGVPLLGDHTANNDFKGTFEQESGRAALNLPESGPSDPGFKQTYTSNQITWTPDDVGRNALVRAKTEKMTGKPFLEATPSEVASAAYEISRHNPDYNVSSFDRASGIALNQVSKRAGLFEKYGSQMTKGMANTFGDLLGKRGPQETPELASSRRKDAAVGLATSSLGAALMATLGGGAARNLTGNQNLTGTFGAGVGAAYRLGKDTYEGGLKGFGATAMREIFKLNPLMNIYNALEGNVSSQYGEKQWANTNDWAYARDEAEKGNFQPIGKLMPHDVDNLIRTLITKGAFSLGPIIKEDNPKHPVGAVEKVLKMFGRTKADLPEDLRLKLNAMPRPTQPPSIKQEMTSQPEAEGEDIDLSKYMVKQ